MRRGMRPATGLAVAIALASVLSACASRGEASGDTTSYRATYEELRGSYFASPSTPESSPAESSTAESSPAESSPAESSPVKSVGPSSPAAPTQPVANDPPVPPVPPAARRFAWADQSDEVPEAFTLTVVRGDLSPRAALRLVAPRPEVRFGTTAAVRRRIDGIEARLPVDYQGPRVQLVAATRRGGYTLVLEDNNFLATEDRVAASLAGSGTATVLFTNVNAQMSYLVARNGRVVRDFDPMTGGDAKGRLPQEDGLPFGSDNNYYWSSAMSLELTRRLTGYRVRPSDFDFGTYSRAVGVKI